ncbi:homeobox-leucine zipper protein HOX12 [Oryza brachyantha]|uniref:Homeobox-leucine zipper protein n=1 Tax=Oryza brachyantha TaxID=4533 RepID=J3LL16_ORYBR|nr:homeobox-leucine zipper protein HOX12 [Oryza brachyantha]
MTREGEEKLLFPSFAFPECFPEAVTSGGEQKKARQRRRRKVKPEAFAAATGESGVDEQAKKRRLSDEQARFLEMSFKKERKLETPRKVQLAAELGLDAKQVAVWFQNRRARHKSKLMEEEFAKLRSAHDAVVLQNCHLETELLKLKERLADVEEEKAKLAAAAAATGGGSAGGGGGSSPSSSSFSTVTYHPALVGQFGVEAAAEEADLYMSEYAYNNYMLELAAAGYGGGVYDQFS